MIITLDGETFTYNQPLLVIFVCIIIIGSSVLFYRFNPIHFPCFRNNMDAGYPPSSDNT